MSRVEALCGEPYHPIKSCVECTRIDHQRRSTTPICRSCRVRFYVHPPRLNELYNPLILKKGEVTWLENAARVFDEYAEERHTAHDFIAWLMPDLLGKGRPDHRDYDGIRREDRGDGPGQGHWPPQSGRMVTRR